MPTETEVKEEAVVTEPEVDTKGKEVETDTEVETSDENAEILEEGDESTEELTEEELEAKKSEEDSLVELLKRADVKDFLKKVRQQEKDKLYDTMKKKDEKIKELTETVSTLEKTVEAYKSGKDTTIQDLQVEVENLKKKVEDAEKATAEKNLELYRTKQIQSVRDAGLDLIEDLVKGSSEEEIDSSIEIAKAKYEEIVAKASSKKEGKPVPKPVAPKQDLGARKLTMEEIQNMSPSEYAKHREQIKKGLL